MSRSRNFTVVFYKSPLDLKHIASSFADAHGADLVSCHRTDAYDIYSVRYSTLKTFPSFISTVDSPICPLIYAGK